MLEKKWGYNGTLQQLFIDLKKASNSARREILHSKPPIIQVNEGEKMHE
jgi:hypothetical protein